MPGGWRRVARALTMAGSDSGGGAGIQADLKTFHSLGVYGMSAITAVTWQNTLAVSGYRILEPEEVEEQIRLVTSDIGVDAAKTGMLGNAGIIEAVARAVGDLRIPNLVVDPVMIAKGGRSLLAPQAVGVLKERLLPLARVLTPNLPEAVILTGMSISGPEHMKEAARRLVGMGAAAVVVKGGHLEGSARDLLYDGNEFTEFPAERVETRHTHGTGCTFSAALAAFLARGFDLAGAVGEAKRYVTWSIRDSLGLGQGQGPTNHWAYPGLARGPQPPGGRPGQAATQGREDLARRLKLYLVTDPGLSRGRSHSEVADEAIKGGVSCIQLRDKTLSTSELCRVGLELAGICRRAGVLFIVNDRTDIAAAVRADGVHLGQDDLDPAEARRILGPDRIIGVTCETPEEARRAEEAGADYLGTGPVYATGTKADAGDPFGPPVIERVSRAVRLPVVGIGGIAYGRAAQVIEAGAAGAAVVSAIAGAEKPALAAAALLEEIEAALASRGRRWAGIRRRQSDEP